jgi:hypothetical protein
MPCQPIPCPSHHSETLNCGHPESKATINQSITGSGVSSTLSKSDLVTKRNTNSHSYKLKKNTNHGLQARNQFTARPGIFQNFFSYTYTWKKQILPTSHKQIPTTPTLHHTSTHLNPTLTLSSFKFFSTLPGDH